MRGIMLAVMLVLVVGGCRHPLVVATNSRLQVDGPFETYNRVVVEVAPSSTSNPVVGTPLYSNDVTAATATVAVVDLDGVLLNTPFSGPYSAGENPVALFREKLDAVSADPTVRAVVLRINSPGGSVTASDIMWHELEAFRIRTRLPVVACLMDVSAGGAYYLATAADVILAHPTTITGGIGVILNLYNLQDLMAQFNILSQEVKAGELIDMGTPTQHLPEEVRALLQTMADEYHQRFINVVRQARPGIVEDDGRTFDGRVFTAREAQSRRLIDHVGYLDDALNLAAELGQHPGALPVLYHRPDDPARSPYAITPNIPLQATGWPFSIPGLDRSRLPAFLYLWQPETTLERMSGR